jgi:hypothetical protein
MEAVRTSETLVNFNVTTRRYIQQDSKLHRRHICRLVNLESQNLRYYSFHLSTVSQTRRWSFWIFYGEINCQLCMKQTQLFGNGYNHFTALTKRKFEKWGQLKREPYRTLKTIEYRHSLGYGDLSYAHSTLKKINPWRYRLWRTLVGWAAAADSLSRLHQTVLSWHVVSTSNPTAAFSAFQTGPLLLYSSNYSVYPITRLSGPLSTFDLTQTIL